MTVSVVTSSGQQQFPIQAPALPSATMFEQMLGPSSGTQTAYATEPGLGTPGTQTHRHHHHHGSGSDSDNGSQVATGTTSPQGSGGLLSSDMLRSIQLSGAQTTAG
jgi:hypothetical protein